MWETADWVFRIVMLGGVFGLFVWAYKNWKSEQGKPRRAGDQTLSLDEINNKCEICALRCKEARSSIKKELEGEMTHIKEALERDLAAGRKRFESLEKKIERCAEALTENTIAVRVLATAVEKSNEPRSVG